MIYEAAENFLKTVEKGPCHKLGTRSLEYTGTEGREGKMLSNSIMGSEGPGVFVACYGWIRISQLLML